MTRPPVIAAGPRTAGAGSRHFPARARRTRSSWRRAAPAPVTCIKNGRQRADRQRLTRVNGSRRSSLTLGSMAYRSRHADDRSPDMDCMRFTRSSAVAAVIAWTCLVGPIHAQEPESPAAAAPSRAVEVPSESESPAPASIPRNRGDGKTRAQVRRELEQAERVGEMKRIDRFFGSGS
ncbi:DUF4148 domain-containing protein [Burkholderia contaminans]|uniref:DUF4148 domain-containing protein n=2 Tax=Burkholderia contaminans TaxID=488447 RepID=A0A3N8RNC4_9BURK|nr:DUF4148 domain-containing protein [Burkholderia contaminans]